MTNEITEYKERVIQTYSKKIPQLYRNTLKIRDYQEDSPNWKNLRVSLNLSAQLVGTNKLEDSDYPILKKFLSEQFKDFSAEEILMAFYKKAGGEIYVDRDHYGKFSGEYLGLVLNAYKNYRNKQLGDELRQENAQNDTLEADREQKKQIRREYIQECFLKPYNALKLGSNKFDRTNGLYFFQFMWKNKIISLSDLEVEKYREKATFTIEMTESARAKNSRGIMEIKRKLKEIDQGGKNDLLQKIKNEACHLYFVDWCKEQIKAGTDIEQFLETNKFYEV
jgi:hypothetical protein